MAAVAQERVSEGAKTGRGWNVLDREAGVLWREYPFGRGTATTFVFRGAGDGLIVVSPARHIEESALDELSDFGKVVALVANNSYHWLGQRHWRKHFPDAKSFAPAQGISRLSKKLPEFGAFEPLEALAPLLGERATVTDGAGLKVANAFASVQGTKGNFWFASDFLSNIVEVPPSFAFRALMKLTDSGPGFQLFRPAVWLQVRDKAAMRAWAEEQITRAAPTTIVPAHGPPVHGAEVAKTAVALFARL
jgi:hypothetical protein